MHQELLSEQLCVDSTMSLFYSSLSGMVACILSTEENAIFTLIPLFLSYEFFSNVNTFPELLLGVHMCTQHFEFSCHPSCKMQLVVIVSMRPNQSSTNCDAIPKPGAGELKKGVKRAM